MTHIVVDPIEIARELSQSAGLELAAVIGDQRKHEARHIVCRASIMEQLFAAGHAVAEIAELLELKPANVRYHLRKVGQL